MATDPLPEILNRDIPNPESPADEPTQISLDADPEAARTSLPGYSPPIAPIPINERSSTSIRSRTPIIPVVSPYTPPQASCGINATTVCVTTTSAEPTNTESSSSLHCIPADRISTRTNTVIVYTDTTTFYGNSTDYTPPYPPITTTPYCTPIALPLPSGTAGKPIITRPNKTIFTPTTTFVTTEKNPSVIFSPGPVPGYSSTNEAPAGVDPGGHQTVWPEDPDPDGNEPTKDAPKAAPKPTFTVTAGSDYVVIGDATFSGIKPGQTSTVVAGGVTFTIFPTAVVGEGVTVNKPAPAAPVTDIAPSPSKTNVGGLPISVSGSVVEIDGRTLTVPPKGTTTVINGEHVSLAPGTAIVGHSETFTWAAKSPVQSTDVFVAGGDMLTAIGSSILVLHSTTITYGPGIDKSVTTIDDDTITIAPSGIVVHSSTLGGPSADASDTAYEIVGGVTVTQLGSSIVIANGHTYTIGSGIDPLTTSLGGEAITIGPHGVVASSMTFDPNNGAAVTRTFEPKGTWTSDFPTETGSSNDNEDGEDEDDVAGTLRPDMLLMGVCIAIGFWVFT